MSSLRVFKTTDPPGWHCEDLPGRSTRWLTWSSAFRDFVSSLCKSALRRRVLLIDVRGCSPYPTSYYLPLDVLSNLHRAKLLEFAAHLHRFPGQSELCLFRDMLTPPLDGGRIRAVFALLRTALVTLLGDERAALCSPLPSARKDLGFRLHADLFLTTRLWLIFDDVPDDNTGASLFMTRRDLLKAVRSIRAIPEDTACFVAALLTKPIARDSFDRLYRLLHCSRNRWHEALRTALREKTSAVRFRSGEGYLIDDRRWLHGRTAVSGKVTSKRFHRLTYGLRS
jgi:hypothetical protein